jgi:16S rRNA (cytosine1402-N4)-methyltransferase
MQVDDPSRGISYAHDGPLDMRMDPTLGRTGADLLASMSEAELSGALRDLADEPDHARIAQWIVAQRQAAPIRTTGQLVRLVLGAKSLTPTSWQRQADYRDPHPAARTFQALRILVNDELGQLQRLLEQAPRLLGPGGRIGIIGFQPGEDALVKRWFDRHRRAGVYSAVADRPIQPGPSERRANPRSASALFRWARRAGGAARREDGA